MDLPDPNRHWNASIKKSQKVLNPKKKYKNCQKHKEYNNFFLNFAKMYIKISFVQNFIKIKK